MPVLFAIILIDISGFGILLPSIMFVLQKMGASPAYATLVIAAYSMGQFLVGPLWGRLSDHIGRKPVLMISMAGAFCAYLLMISAQSVEMILVSRILAGLMAGSIATAYAAVADMTKPENRAKGMGVLGAAFGLGFVIGPAIGGFLGGDTPESANIYYPSIASAVMSGTAFLATALFFKESLSQENRDALKEKAPVGRLAALHFIAGHPVLSRLCGFVLMVALTSSLMEPVTPLLVGNRYGWGPLNMGYIFTAVGISIAVVQGSMVGRLVGWFGESNLAKIALGLLATGLLLIMFTPVPGGVVAGLILTGIGQTLFTTAVGAMASHRAAPTERGLVMGFVQSMQSFGRSVGPLFAGSLFVFWPELPYAVGVLLVSAAFLWLTSLARAIPLDPARDKIAPAPHH